MTQISRNPENQSKGLFISFEGIDGAGKSTHIDALAKAFETQGRTVIRTREPGGTDLAEKIRSIVLNDPMDAMTEALLVFAARRDHVNRIIQPALNAGKVVLCDRFTDASFAYQGGGRAFDWPTLEILENWVHPGLQPDITVWFDLPPAVAATRLEGSRIPDKFESQGADFFTSVANAYAKRAQQFPKRFARINANQSIESVWNEVHCAFQMRGFLK